MRYLLLLGVFFLLASCSKDDSTQPAAPQNTDTQSTPVPAGSQFQQFLGSWKLDSTRYNADVFVDENPEIMTFENNLNNGLLTGRIDYKWGNPKWSEKMEVRLPGPPAEIILWREVGTFYCTYKFDGPNHFYLDDSTIDEVNITYWSRNN